MPKKTNSFDSVGNESARGIQRVREKNTQANSPFSKDPHIFKVISECQEHQNGVHFIKIGVETQTHIYAQLMSETSQTRKIRTWKTDK